MLSGSAGMGAQFETVGRLGVDDGLGPAPLFPRRRTAFFGTGLLAIICWWWAGLESCAAPSNTYVRLGRYPNAYVLGTSFGFVCVAAPTGPTTGLDAEYAVLTPFLPNSGRQWPSMNAPDSIRMS